MGSNLRHTVCYGQYPYKPGINVVKTWKEVEMGVYILHRSTMHYDYLYQQMVYFLAIKTLNLSLFNINSVLSFY